MGVRKTPHNRRYWPGQRSTGGGGSSSPPTRQVMIRTSSLSGSPSSGSSNSPFLSRQITRSLPPPLAALSRSSRRFSDSIFAILEQLLLERSQPRLNVIGSDAGQYFLEDRNQSCRVEGVELLPFRQAVDLQHFGADQRRAVEVYRRAARGPAGRFWFIAQMLAPI